MFRADPPAAPPPAPAGPASETPTQTPAAPPAAPVVVPASAAPAPVPPPRAQPGPGLTPGLARPRRVASRGPGRRRALRGRAPRGLAAVYLVARPARRRRPPGPDAPGRPRPRSGAPARPPATGAVAPEAAPPAPPPPRALAGVAEVVDTATLKLGGRVVRLFGVEWAKGGQAQDLTGYLAGRPVNCQPAAGDSYQCAVDGHDLSEVVLYNGGGRASADATPDLVEAERRARTEKVGIWRK